eukprot:3060278-Rhodomonas_salina.2
MSAVKSFSESGAMKRKNMWKRGSAVEAHRLRQYHTPRSDPYDARPEARTLCQYRKQHASAKSMTRIRNPGSSCTAIVVAPDAVSVLDRAQRVRRRTDKAHHKSVPDRRHSTAHTLCEYRTSRRSTDLGQLHTRAPRLPHPPSLPLLVAAYPALYTPNSVYRLRQD